MLEPRPQIFLFGDDEGNAKLATELGVKHFPDSDLLCYVNTGMILSAGNT